MKCIRLPENVRENMNYKAFEIILKACTLQKENNTNIFDAEFCGIVNAYVSNRACLSGVSLIR